MTTAAAAPIGAATAGRGGQRRVGRLSVAVETGSSTLRFPYVSDLGDRGALSVTYPFDLTAADLALTPVMAAAAGLYLGQLCLAARIEIDAPLVPAVEEPLQGIASMLYDVRCWKDGIDLVGPPVFRGGRRGRPTDPLARPDGGGDRVALMWSGGKDSTLAAILLGEAGYDVTGIHLTANAGVEERELASVTGLAEAFGLPLTVLRYAHPEFIPFSSRYATEWNRRPLCNRVPFGRDLLLPVLSLPEVRRQGAAVISMGHDNECRNAMVEWQGRRFPRNDVESAAGALLLERLIGEALPGVGLLPPLAALSELEILRRMLVDHPAEMAQVSFCFWPGRNCGRCAKCLRYYLAQRAFAPVEVLSFEVNPLADGASPELDDLLSGLDVAGLLFQKEVLYCLGVLAARGDVRREEARLADFVGSALHAAVEPRLAEWEVELLTPGTDPQLRGRHADRLPGRHTV